MFGKKNGEKKKRSWELDGEDDAPSETFLQLQQELEARERLAKENAEIMRLREIEEAQRVKDEAASAEQKALSSTSSAGEEGNPVDDRCTILVNNYHPKTRIHELKAHFLQVCRRCLLKLCP